MLPGEAPGLGKYSEHPPLPAARAGEFGSLQLNRIALTEAIAHHEGGASNLRTRRVLHQAVGNPLCCAGLPVTRAPDLKRLVLPMGGLLLTLLSSRQWQLLGYIQSVPKDFTSRVVIQAGRYEI